MNILEALTLKKDLKERIEDLESRLTNSVTVLKGRKPIEDPQSLMTQLEDSSKQLNDICCRIKMSAERLKAFAEILEKNGITTTVRRTLGPDIEASCGQLRRNHAKEASEILGSLQGQTPARCAKATRTPMPRANSAMVSHGPSYVTGWAATLAGTSQAPQLSDPSPNGSLPPTGRT